MSQYGVGAHLSDSHKSENEIRIWRTLSVLLAVDQLTSRDQVDLVV